MMLVKWICECGNVVISEVKENDGEFYTDYYCLDCQKKNPLNSLIIQRVKR